MKSSTKVFILIISLLVIFALGIFLFFTMIIVSGDDDDVETITGKGEKIAVIELKGVILESEKIVKQFKKYRNDRSIKAILFRIDSPGGGVVASHEIYDEVRKTREFGKPVVVSMASVAASGGYYVSCGANKIVANPGTLTGSIGVISQFLRLDPMLAKVGIEMNTIKSGKFKDAGTPFRGMTEEDKKYFQNLMDDVHKQFIDIVSKERNIEHNEIIKIADGRVFTGEEAYKLKLVDTLGTFEDAVRITAELANIKGEPSIVREVKRKTFIERLLGETKFDSIIGLKDEIFSHPILQYKLYNP
ncbi:MAG: Signal peptide peptidase SppA, 36K type [Ignavibacteriae bacterium]|nr:MAG: Signal peptide peptidase SppA, 36K type [Ignavibacteriota bacterium]